MKKVIFIVLIFICLIMTIMSYLFFDSENSIMLFSGGSVGSTMKYFVISKWIVLFLYIITVFSVYFYRNEIKKMLFYFVICFSLWFLSGRMIGVQYTGEIITGWFYLETDKIILWEANKCTDDVIRNTKMENSYLFNLKFTNACTTKEIYIGPFIMLAVENYFGQKTPDRANI